VSVGAGLRGRTLQLLDPAKNQQTLDLVWNAGIFYDRENSLMASLFFSGLTEYTVSANIYPGILRIGDFSPGLWVVFGRERLVLAGITTVWAPGIGVRTK
jgi:hypothetical protein